MRLFLTISLGVIAWAVSADAAERRCGWYGNPTPGDLLLTDRQGDWWITGGGEDRDAKGIENTPQMDETRFVETNVPGAGRGYNCACLTVETNAKTHRVLRVFAGEIVPLARCRADKALPSPD
ncbi:DUF4087 domain-containing protein [Mesorhizobium sp. 1M-11]|uniref:DUF4087 domain-containing protein n=1 Tax=Mesorhizobium sp. 1M-11 TaxID=1529006 RepID=UPI0006C7598B|nr:DUF4087 domain-containing protein [Mesorhizobium sp. 1M-11]